MLVTPQGGKFWRLAYRFNGKQKTLSIGEYPYVSITNARAKREEAKGQLINGIDPSAAKVAAKQARWIAKNQRVSGNLVCSKMAPLIKEV